MRQRRLQHGNQTPVHTVIATTMTNFCKPAAARPPALVLNDSVSVILSIGCMLSYGYLQYGTD